MPRSGITQESILTAAVQLTGQVGLEGLTMRGLAGALHIQAPSLYNHISGMEEIRAGVAVRVQEQLSAALEAAARGLARDDALRALAAAYQAFARENPRLYQAVLALPKLQDERALAAASTSAAPIAGVLRGYRLTETQVTCLYRMLRSYLHGYLSLNEAGYLCHGAVSARESFEAGLEAYIDAVHAQEGKSSDAV